MSKPKRKYGGRRDGARINRPSSDDLNALFPYIMKRRTDSVIYFTETIDVENLLAYIAEKKAEGKEIKFFELFMIAVIKLLRERPQLNRFIKGRRLYQRETVDVNFVAKRKFEENAPETNVCLRFRNEEGFDDILKKIRGDISSAKAGEMADDDKTISALMRLPRSVLMFLIKILDFMDFYHGIPWMLENVDPLRCSAMLANLGSIGIDAPYHHLFEWGTCSIFICIGRIKKMPQVDDEGNITVKTMVEVKITLDERIADGFYGAKSIGLLRTYFQNPNSLETL